MSTAVDESVWAPEQAAERVVSRHVIAILGKDDSEFSWDPGSSDEVQVARALFAEMRRTHVMYRVEAGGKQGEQLQEFDLSAARVMAVPPLRGG